MAESNFKPVPPDVTKKPTSAAGTSPKAQTAGAGSPGLSGISTVDTTTGLAGSAAVAATGKSSSAGVGATAAIRTASSDVMAGHGPGSAGDNFDPELRRMNAERSGEAAMGDRSSGTAGDRANRGGFGEQARQGDDAGNRRLQDGLNRGAEVLERLADKIDDFTADRLDQGGVGSQAADYVYSFTDMIESFARYGRNRDFGALKGDLQTQIRRKPLGAVALSLGVGFLMGKVLK